MTQPAGRPGQTGAGPPPPQPERSRLTTRAAVLAVVLCAIALSLAYPVREYIAQRRQIDQLEVQRESIAAKLGALEQQAESKLHMCFPSQTCYVVINPRPPRPKTTAARAPGRPWYERVWTSVQQADKAPAK
jgi:hypothetical protein